MQLHNKYNREVLRKKLEEEDFERITLSFYRYVLLTNVQDLRDEFYKEWSKLGVLGRIYLAEEGINAQISVPSHNMSTFTKKLYKRKEFAQIPFKIAVEDDGKSFLKLAIKVKKMIVADGLPAGHYDIENVGNHMNAEEWNEAMNQEETIVVDMRNHYESEVGHFEGAILPQVETFKEELPEVLDTLKGKEDKKVLLYCTGGIRCEKTSAFLKHHGFKDVNQLHGGIIQYAKEVKQQNLETKFKGVNFVFDERLEERISEDVISECHQCGESCDEITNCKNVACNLLFIQCKKCAEKFSSCCTPDCKDIAALPEEQQRKLRKGIEVKKRFNKSKDTKNSLKVKVQQQLDERAKTE